MLDMLLSRMGVGVAAIILVGSFIGAFNAYRGMSDREAALNEGHEIVHNIDVVSSMGPGFKGYLLTGPTTPVHADSIVFTSSGVYVLYHGQRVFTRATNTLHLWNPVELGDDIFPLSGVDSIFTQLEVRDTSTVMIETRECNGVTELFIYEDAPEASTPMIVTSVQNMADAPLDLDKGVVGDIAEYKSSSRLYLTDDFIANLDSRIVYIWACNVVEAHTFDSVQGSGISEVLWQKIQDASLVEYSHSGNALAAGRFYFEETDDISGCQVMHTTVLVCIRQG